MINKIGIDKIFWILLTVLASVFAVIYLVSTGNQYSLINETIMEMTYSTSINKMCGINLLYMLSFFGLFAYTIFYFFANYKKSDSQKDISPTLIPKIIVIILCIATDITYILWQYLDHTLAYLFIFTLGVYFINKEKVLSGIVLFISNLYTLFAVYRILTLIGFNVELSDTSIFCAISFILSYILLKFKTSKVLLIEQIILPFLLLIFTVDKYGSYLQNISNIEIPITTIPVLWQVKVLIYGLIFVFLSEAVLLIKKYWKSDAALNKIMSYGACVSVMGYNLCLFTGNVVPYDAHHYSENIIGFHQIFKMGQIPFSEVEPTSGLYSILHGAILQVFGNGLVSQYISADNIFCLLVALLIVFLLRFHTDKITRFLICVGFLFPTLFPRYIHYDRVLFVLPIMLILSLPKLIENKNLWICVWILTSLLHGLYYPVLGAAVCIGFIPLAIYQFVSLVSSKTFVKQIKTFQFWICWLITLLTVALSYPILEGLYKLIKLLGNHSAYLGISRFGQDFNKFFMMSSPLLLKQVVLYILTFVVPALLVWIAYAFTLKVLNLKANKKLSDNNIKNACIIFSLVLIPLFSFSYTMLRLEGNKIFVRAESVIIAIVIMLILFAQKYLDSNRNKSYLIGFALCLISISYSWGFTNNNNKLRPYYLIPCLHSYVENDTTYKIGTGYIDSEYYSEIKKICPLFDKQKNYFGIGPYSTYYICDVKGISFLEALTVRYRAVSEHTIDYLLKYNAIVDRDIDSINNYYLYKWLITSGNYIWNPKTKLFYPNNGNYNLAKVRKINAFAKLNENEVNVGYIPTTLAPSISNLSDDFVNPKLNFTVKNYKNLQRIYFKDNIYGEDADFVYLEFDIPLDNYDCSLHEIFDMVPVKGKCNFTKPFVIHNYNSDKIVKIIYSDNMNRKHSITCFLQKGKLLIPLGSGSRWLLHKHSFIDVQILKIQKNGKLQTLSPKEAIIKNAHFLKLKGVGAND